VDDTLVRNYRARHRVHEMIADHRAETLSVEDARAMAARIQRKGPQAVQALFDRLFDEDDPNGHRMAIMLLTEMDDPAVLEQTRTFLKRPHLPERVRVALLAIEALRADWESGDPPATDGLPELTLDSLLQFSEDFWETMEMEEISTMWRENFADESPEDRLLMLEMLMKTAHPKLLGVANLEIAIGNLKIIQFLAQKLGQFDDPLAMRILQRLLLHPHLVIRTVADLSLEQIRERAVRGSTPKLPPLPEARFYRAHMATDAASGHYSLIYSVKSPDGQIKFLVVLLDRWDRGIIDCWGCVHYSTEEFNQLLAAMTRDFADLQQRRIPKRTALTLLNKAMDLNIRRNHALPLELAVWYHLFDHEEFKDDPSIPVFGVECRMCRKAVRTGPRLAPPWVVGDLVVCHRCSTRPLRCPVCGGATTLPKCLVTHEDTSGPLDLRCPHCFETIPIGRVRRSLNEK